MQKFLNEKNKRLTFILVTMFLNFLGFSIIIPILPFLVEKFVVNPNDLPIYTGILFSVYAFCQFLSSPALGSLSDLLGRRPVLLISLLGSVVGYLFLALGGSFWVILVGRIIDGLTGGNISTVYAYLADISEPYQRSKYYGLVGAAGGFGFMIGPAVGGILGATHVTLPLYLAAAITAVNMIWGYYFLPESLRHEHKIKKFEFQHLNPFGHLFELFKIDILKQLFIVSFLFFTAINAIYSVTAIYSKDVFGWGSAQIGILLFVVGVVDIFVQGYLIRKFIPVFGEVKLTVFGLVLASIGIVTASVTSVYVSVLIFYLGFIVMNIGDGVLEPSISGLTSNAVGPRMQGKVQGAAQGVNSVSRIIGPIAATYIYKWHTSVPYLGSAMLFVISAAILVAAVPTIRAHKVKDAF